MTHGLLVHNPYVYKGYYYDSDTGYYYLKSRYYDPRIHRFLSADKIDYLDPKSLSSLNLYIYCGDNPVMGYDPSGNFPFLITMALLGLIIGAGVGTGIGLSKGHTGWKLVGDIALGGLIGAAAGLVVGAGISGALTGSFFSSWTAVKAGAQLVYGMYKATTLAGAGYMILDNLGNSFHQVTHVFWSGGSIAESVAKNYAGQIGGKTLEMTRTGQYLSRYYSGTNYNQEIWNLVSKNFVNQISQGGIARVILYYPHMRSDAIWFEEAKALADKLIEVIVGRF